MEKEKFKTVMMMALRHYPAPALKKMWQTTLLSLATKLRRGQKDLALAELDLLSFLIETNLLAPFSSKEEELEEYAKDADVWDLWEAKQGLKELY